MLTNSRHARNAVYLAETGDRHEVDLTPDVHRHVYGEDLNDVTGDTLDHVIKKRQSGRSLWVKNRDGERRVMLNDIICIEARAK